MPDAVFGVIVTGNIVIDTSEVPTELQPEASTIPKAARAPRVQRAEQQAPAQVGSTPAAAAPATPNIPSVPTTLTPPPPAAPTSSAPVGVNVTIDMSKWEAKDVLSVLNVLGYGEKSSSE